jgi:hypothetical protein
MNYNLKPLVNEFNEFFICETKMPPGFLLRSDSALDLALWLRYNARIKPITSPGKTPAAQKI